MTVRAMLLSLCVLSLAACVEKDQTLGSKKDAAAFGGTTNGFSVKGWQSGDKNSWEQQLRTRSHYGMNDHQRAPN